MQIAKYFIRALGGLIVSSCAYATEPSDWRFNSSGRIYLYATTFGQEEQSAQSEARVQMRASAAHTNGHSLEIDSIECARVGGAKLLAISSGQLAGYSGFAALPLGGDRFDFAERLDEYS
jgi:hypothetical protein